METLTLRKDKVLEAARACSTAKRTLEILCPEFFEEGNRKDGWYKDDDCPKWMVYFKDGISEYGIDYYGDWFDSGKYYEKLRAEDKPATPQEIEEALIAEAKKMGFKKGVVLQKSGINACFSFTFKQINGKFTYCNDADLLDSENGQGIIYEKGQWASIIPDKKKMTISEIEKALGYEIEVIK